MQESLEENSILRWGGLAGVAAGVIFIFVPIILFGFVPAAPSDPSAVVARFPEVRSAIALGNFVNFVADVFWVCFILAFYRALRSTSPASSLFGSFLFILGFAVLFIETMTQIAFDPLSNLFHAPGTTAAEQATLGYVWQATQGMFNQFDNSTVLLISTGFIILGIAMYRSPVFGRILGGASIVLGAASAVAIAILGTTSVLSALLVIPIYVVFPIIL